MAVPKQLAGLEKVSDLVKFPELRFAVNQEFAGCPDGWNGLAEAYQLHPKNFSEMQHELCYAAVAGGKADVVNVYSTDAQVEKLGLKLLVDDKQYFPRHEGVLLYRADLPTGCPKAWAALIQLVGKISEEKMRLANAKLVPDKQDAAEAGAFLLKECLPQRATPTITLPSSRGWDWAMIAQRTFPHLQLVSVSLLITIVVGIPLGILASRSPRMAQPNAVAGRPAPDHPFAGLAGFCDFHHRRGPGARPVGALCLQPAAHCAQHLHGPDHPARQPERGGRSPGVYPRWLSCGEFACLWPRLRSTWARPHWQRW